MKRFTNPDVKAVFDSYPMNIRLKLLAIREMIFNVSAENNEIGKIDETLRWGQPSYITNESKSGSLIRLDQKKSKKNEVALFFHCQTTLVSTFRELFPHKLNFEGNRCIFFDAGSKIPEKELRHCINLALTYYLNK